MPERIYAKNIFYIHDFNKIGGTETFLWNIAQKYKDFDILVVYKTGDQSQVNRIRRYVRTERYIGQWFKCEKCFCNYLTDILDHVEAEEYYQIVHTDYKAISYIDAMIDPRIETRIGVSQLACNSFNERYGIMPEVCYNPLVIKKPEKILHLISATRLTREKGRDRIERLAQIFHAHRIPFVWTIYTDNDKAIKDPDIIFRPAKMDITSYIADSDYLVQLSDGEAYCYSVVEALCLGVPVIVTPCPVFSEIGVENGKNGYILDFDLQKVPVEDIYKNIPKFTYTPLDDRWNDILAPGESTYKNELADKCLMVATRRYFDISLKREVLAGEELFMTPERAKVTFDARCTNYVDY